MLGTALVQTSCGTGDTDENKDPLLEARYKFLGTYQGTLETTSDPVSQALLITPLTDSITAIDLAFPGINLTLKGVAIGGATIKVPSQIRSGYQYSGYGTLTGNNLTLTLAQSYGGITFYDKYKGKKQ